MKLVKFNGVDDYNKLNHLPFNRNCSVRQDLMNKMHKYGFTVPINIIKTDIIDGKNKMWIADGQHRAMTALHIDIEFTGVIQDIVFNNKADIVRYVASLNSASKPWNMLNYVQSYNYLNYEDYAVLLKTTANSPYTVNTVSLLLAGIRSKGSSMNKIKEGKYKVTMYDEGVKTLKYAAHLSKYEKVTSRMILALSYVMGLPRFDEASFTKKYMQNSKAIKELNLDDYTDIFQSWV